MELTLSTPVQFLPRVGPAMAKRLSKLNIFTLEDLLYHIPFRYNDYSVISPINRIRPGETVTISGVVTTMKNVFTKNGKKMQQAGIADHTGKITATWFNQPFLTNVIKPGMQMSLSGKADWFGHTLVFSSPEYEIIQSASLDSGNQAIKPDHQSLHTGRLVPVYPETEGVSSKWLRGRVAYTLDFLQTLVPEFLPDSILKHYNLIKITDAIRMIHFPNSPDDTKTAYHRLAFDELFILLLSAKIQRRVWESTQKAHTIRVDPTDINRLIQTLPFSLTHDQNQSLSEIIRDMQRPIPMNRLLEGDVGSGKTVVAALAMYASFRAGFQSILMAPTTILADQHYQTITKFLSPLGLTINLITGSTKRDNRGTLNSERNTKFDILIGTHALLSQSVVFDTTGLVVIDEQQRFGVAQRTILRNKTKGTATPHLLTMTATPIPRTVARVLYGNLDLSLLSEMPIGRTPVKTWVIPNEKRKNAYAWIQKQIEDTQCQAFIVCPLIDESESLTSVRAVTREYEILKNTVFPTYKVGLMHGRLKPREKDDVLEQFRSRHIDILVTTPVVEVGIDIPNATVMMIETAERFGLSQLHQLRGRVGRGSLLSYCLLFTEMEDDQVNKRLKAMETNLNGAELAQLDFTLRGPGDLFGTRQHGDIALKIASFADMELIKETQRAVDELSNSDPELTTVPLLREKLKTDTIATQQD